MIRLESDHDLILLFEHDLFGKPVHTFPDHALVAFGPGRGIANRTGGALRRSATGPYSTFRAGLRAGAGLFSGRARLRIKFLVAATRRPALHIAPALRAAADLGVG